MEHYNTDFLIRVKVHDFFRSLYYDYVHEKESRWSSKDIDRHYYTRFNDEWSDTCPKEHILRDGTVWEKPEVILHYTDGRRCTYVFDTYEEAKEFGAQFIVDSKWIQ